MGRRIIFFKLGGGESHYSLGQRYRLRVIEYNAATKVELRNKTCIDLNVCPEAGAEQREQVLQGWCRRQLRGLILPLLEKWQVIPGVQVADWV